MAGEKGCYFVDAQDIWGNSLFPLKRDANVVTFTELDLTPSVGTPEGSPVDLTAHDVSDGVRLGWEDVADAVGYRVYRWDRDTCRYESLTSEPVTATAWADTTAPAAPPTSTG